MLATHPRALEIAYLDLGPDNAGPGPCSFRYRAEVDPAFQRISGTLSCAAPAGNQPCGCAGQQQALTLVR